jgi:hypothetical protein
VTPPSARSERSPDGVVILGIGAWAALAPAALGLVELAPATVLPGATVALGGAAILTGRATIPGSMLALAGALWLVLGQIGGLYGPDPALTPQAWLAAFLAPGALAMLVAVHALGGADSAEAPARRLPHGPKRPVRTRDPHGRGGVRAPQGAHRQRQVRGDV